MVLVSMVLPMNCIPAPSRARPVMNVRLCAPLAVAFVLRVICVGESIDLIVVMISGVPGVGLVGSVGIGMPVPMTDCPTNRPAVLDSPVTTGELNVRLLPD